MLIASLVILHVIEENQNSIIETLPPVNGLMSSMTLDSNGDILYGTRTGEIHRIHNDEDVVLYTVPSMISCISLTDTGKILVGSEDRHLYILSSEGILQRSTRIGDRIFRAIDVGDGRIALLTGTGIRNYYVRLLDDTGNESWKASIGYEARVLLFDPLGRTLFYATKKSTVGALDLEGNTKWTTTTSKPILSGDLDNSSQNLILGDSHGSIVVLSPAGETQSRLEVSGTEILCLATAEDGKILACGDTYGQLRVLQRDGSSVFERHYMGSDRKDLPVRFLSTNSNGLMLAGIAESRLELISMTRLTNQGLYQRLHVTFRVVLILSILLIVAFLALSFHSIRHKVLTTLGRAIHARIAYLMILPGTVLLAIFMFFPIGKAFVMSMTEWTAESYARPIFVGFANFVRMFSGEDPYFWTGFGNMFLLIAASMVKVITMPLLVAELVFFLRSTRLKYTFRILFISPMVVPGLVLLLMWRNMYDPNIGLINILLRDIGLSGLARSWLGEASTVIGAIIFMGFPWIDGFAFLLYFGALLNIPGEVFDSALVDGCTPRKRFLNIDLPYLRSQIRVMMVLYFINGVKDFSGIWLLTQGGPGYSSYVPSLELFMHMTRFNNYGYASALGVFLFAVTMVGTLINLRFRDSADLQSR